MDVHYVRVRSSFLGLIVASIAILFVSRSVIDSTLSRVNKETEPRDRISSLSLRCRLFSLYASMYMHVYIFLSYHAVVIRISQNLRTILFLRGREFSLFCFICCMSGFGMGSGKMGCDFSFS